MEKRPIWKKKKGTPREPPPFFRKGTGVGGDFIPERKTSLRRLGAPARKNFKDLVQGRSLHSREVFRRRELEGHPSPLPSLAFGKLVVVAGGEWLKGTPYWEAPSSDLGRKVHFRQKRDRCFPGGTFDLKKMRKGSWENRRAS